MLLKWYHVLIKSSVIIGTWSRQAKLKMSQMAKSLSLKPTCFPLLTWKLGDMPKKIDFNFGAGTEVYLSCTTVYNGETLIFGGAKEYNQFSRAKGCGLIRIGDLPFTLDLYSKINCGVFNFEGDKETVLICRQQCFE